MTSNITDQITPWMNGAVEEHGQGEPILWDATLMPVQMAAGEPPLPRYVVFVWFPGHVPGTYLNGSFAVDDLANLDQEGVRATMQEMLRQFREARSQNLSTETAQAAPAASGRPARGSQTASGLIIG